MTAAELIAQAEARHAHHVGYQQPPNGNPRAIVYACRECWTAVITEALDVKDADAIVEAWSDTLPIGLAIDITEEQRNDLRARIAAALLQRTQG